MAAANPPATAPETEAVTAEGSSTHKILVDFYNFKGYDSS